MASAERISLPATRNLTCREDVINQVNQTLISSTYRERLSQCTDLPIHVFEQSQDSITGFTKIPEPSNMDLAKPFLVTCYLKGIYPSNFTILGICTKYYTGIRAQNLSFCRREEPVTVPDPMEMQELKQERGPELEEESILVIPDFFVYKGRPSLPRSIHSSKLFKDFSSFSIWMKSFGRPDSVIMLPPLEEDATPLDLLMFVWMLSAYEKPELLLVHYRGYIKVHLRGYIPDARRRLEFAQKMGILVSGPGEVEEKIVHIASLEMARLRDEKDMWLPRMPLRLYKLMTWIDELVGK
jgi:hypothetical protein